MPSDSARAWIEGVACVVIVTSLSRAASIRYPLLPADKVCAYLAAAAAAELGELINPFIRSEVVTSADRFANRTGRRRGGGRGQCDRRDESLGAGIGLEDARSLLLPGSDSGSRAAVITSRSCSISPSDDVIDEAKYISSMSHASPSK